MSWKDVKDARDASDNTTRDARRYVDTPVGLVYATIAVKHELRALAELIDLLVDEERRHEAGKDVTR